MSNREDDNDTTLPPPVPGVRVTVSLEPEAAAMLDELTARLYPARRAGQARALVMEMGIRMLHKRVLR